MTIRHATSTDIPQLLEWMAEFHAKSNTLVPFNADYTGEFLGMLTDKGVVLMHEHGMIGGIITPAFCNGEWLQAHEIFWFAKRDGLQLLTAFEAWAKASGANEVRMSSLCEIPRSGELLLHRGYTAIDTFYSKVP